MAVPEYFDRHNPDLLSLIPPDARTILEVGCGAGKLAELYRRLNPGVEWVGVDCNADALEIAHDRGVMTVMADAGEDLPLPCMQIPDVLILGDVLEHLRDPWKTLERLAHLIKPGGLVLASIPNVGHYSVILGLLGGRWRYEDEGLLDRTHLRFFTLESIRELFAGAGLEIFEVRGRKCFFDAKAWGEFERRCPEDKDDPHLKVYQWVVRAVKPPAEVYKLHIHAVTAEGCCARVRIHEPFAALGTIPGVKCTTGGAFVRTAPFTWLDIEIQQRFRGLNLAMQRVLVEDGVLLVAEIDDDPRGLQGLPECDFLPLRAVHAVQCSTEAIAEVVRQYNPHVAVFPNQIADLPPWEERAGDAPPTLFYGAQNREASWAPIMPALNRVLADHRGVKFEVVHDRLFFDALEAKYKTFHPFLPYERYRAVLRTCDIALLPLEDHPFNRCKSDLKFLECAAEGVAALASELVFGQTMRWQPDFHNDLGWAYRDAGEFATKLRLMLEPGCTRAFAERAYAYVRDHRLLGQHYRHQYAWYLDLLSRRSGLDRSLRERVPALS